MSTPTRTGTADRSVFFGLPRRYVALVWLPVVVVLVFTSGQRVSPGWLYPVGLVPAAAGWLVFTLRPQLPARGIVLAAAALTAGGVALLLGSDGWTSAASFPMVGAFLLGLRLPYRPAVAGAVVIAAALVWVVGPYDDVLDALVVAGLVGLMVLVGIARRDNLRRTEEHEHALVADARAREEHARAESIADRARVARDVHDVLAHSLSALAVQLQGARLMAQRDGAAADTVAQIERAQRLTSDGLTEARRAVRALREGPGPVEVVAELRELAETHPDATVEVDPAVRLGPREGETVLRTAQEALSNARKHAPGAPVAVRLQPCGEHVELEVVDVAGAPPDDGDGRGSGLTGMAERAALVGAHLDVGPTADGWRVALRVPRIGAATGSGDPPRGTADGGSDGREATGRTET